MIRRFLLFFFCSANSWRIKNWIILKYSNERERGGGGERRREEKARGRRVKYHLCKCTVYFRSTRVRDVVERTKRDYIMAGHAFLRVLKSSGSKHELWTSECFIHRYGFAATGERFLMCSVKKKRMNERKKERKTSPHSKEKEGEGKRECMCVHIRACMREREREGQS